MTAITFLAGMAVGTSLGVFILALFVSGDQLRAKQDERQSKHFGERGGGFGFNSHDSGDTRA